MITSFPSVGSDNIGGCRQFQFTESENLLPLFIGPTRQVSAPIGLTGDSVWHLGYASDRTLVFNEKPGENDAGVYYVTEITGFYPRLSPQALALFSQMKGKTFVVIIQDNNGFNRLCGTPENPMEFRFNQSTGDNPGSRNGFSFSFTCQSLAESPFVM